jgi:uncharacterized protein YcaQ
VTETIGLAQARRIALAAQGFGARRPDTPAGNHLLRVIDRLQLHQIDSVNVLIRAHYLPAFPGWAAMTRPNSTGWPGAAAPAQAFRILGA